MGNPGRGDSGKGSEPAVSSAMSRRRFLVVGADLAGLAVASMALNACTTAQAPPPPAPGGAPPPVGMPARPVAGVEYHETWMGADGPNWPDGWQTFGDTVDVRGNAGRVITGTDSNDSAGASRPGIADGEILLAWQWTADIEERYLELHCRRQGGDGYGLVLDGSEVRLRMLADGGDDHTDLATAEQVLDAGTWYWTRFRWSGPALQGRVWLDGTPEPATWDVEATDDTYKDAGQIVIQVLTGDDGGELGAIFNEFWLWRDMVGPQLVFIGDFDTGNLQQWGGDFDADGDQEPELVSTPVRTDRSRYACRFSVAAPYIRCEVDGNDRGGALLQREGTEYFYGWSVWYVSPFPVGQWQITGQWHSNGGNGDGWDDVSPPMSVAVASTQGGLDPTHWYIDCGRSGLATAFPTWSADLGPMIFDRWVDVVTRAVVSTVPQRCQLQVWIDGRMVADLVPPAPLLYPTTNTDRYNYLKVGYYRHHEITAPGQVLFDNVRIGHSYASVDPSA
jgi:hypothetical protein